MKHESATIFFKYNHRRALKDISDALEQLPSSKDISEAHRVFYQITNQCVSLSKGVCSKHLLWKTKNQTKQRLL